MQLSGPTEKDVLASMADVREEIVGSEQALDLNKELQHVIVDNVSVPIANIVGDLVANDKKTIYIVGEGNFSFTLAIVALNDYMSRKEYTFGKLSRDKNYFL